METQSPFDAPGEPNDPSAGTVDPKFGIIHLLGWTACVAILLGLQEAISTWAYGEYLGESNDSPGDSAQRILGSLVSGAAVGSLVMLAARRWRGVPYPRHPGEFLGILLGVTALVQLATQALDLIAIRHGSVFSAWEYFLPDFLATLLIVFWAARLTRERRWRTFFLGIAVLACAEYGLLVFFTSDVLSGVWRLRYLQVIVWFFRWMWLPLLLPLTVAVLNDRHSRRHRPWTHWLGLGVLVCRWVLTVIL